MQACKGVPLTNGRLENVADVSRCCGDQAANPFLEVKDDLLNFGGVKIVVRKAG